MMCDDAASRRYAMRRAAHVLREDAASRTCMMCGDAANRTGADTVVRSCDRIGQLALLHLFVHEGMFLDKITSLVQLLS